jgi:hypothetical protein
LILDPDLSPNDGLYTAYFTQYSGNGPYNVAVNAIAGTNESVAIDYYPFDDMDPSNLSNSQANNQTSASRPLSIDAFMRSTFAGALILSNYTAKDLMPPARITDLTVLGSNYTNRSVTFQWTATGDDAHTGSGICL